MKDDGYPYEGCIFRDEQECATWRISCRVGAAIFGGLALACLLRAVL